MNPESLSAFPEGQNAHNPLDLELVFHPLGDCAQEESAAFSEATRRVLDADKAGEVHIVCPYLSSQLLSGIVQNRAFRLVTDIQACFEAGADESLASFLEGHMDNVRHMSGVHAKVVTTKRAALLGSANLTQSGFGARDEMGCLIYNANLLRILRDWFDSLWSASRCIRDQDILSSRHRPPRRHDTSGTESTRRGKIPRQPTRSIGWLSSCGAFASLERSERDGATATPAETAVREEREALVAQIRDLSDSRAQADTILGLLAKALDISGLSLDDTRLHLNFGKNPICININQRHVAWCCVERQIPQFGFILDNSGVATDATLLLEGSWSGNFRKRGTDDLPTIHVPLAQLSRLPLAVLDSWQRAIRIQVDRRCRDGSPWTSSYRKYTRPYLFYVLRDEGLREVILRRAFPGGKAAPARATGGSPAG